MGSYQEMGQFNFVPGDGYLDGYRTPVNGFPVVQALIEPLGTLVACIALAYLLLARKKSEELTFASGGEPGDSKLV
jgi:hypothetical protein